MDQKLSFLKFKQQNHHHAIAENASPTQQMNSTSSCAAHVKDTNDLSNLNCNYNNVNNKCVTDSGASNFLLVKPSTRLEQLEDSLNQASIESLKLRSSSLSSTGLINLINYPISNPINSVGQKLNANIANNLNSLFDGGDQKILSLRRSISEKLRNSIKNKTNNIQNVNAATTNPNPTVGGGTGGLLEKIEPRKWHSERYKKNTVILSECGSTSMPKSNSNFFAKYSLKNSTQIPLSNQQKAVLAKYTQVQTTGESQSQLVVTKLNQSATSSTTVNNNNNNNNITNINNPINSKSQFKPQSQLKKFLLNNKPNSNSSSTSTPSAAKSPKLSLLNKKLSQKLGGFMSHHRSSKNDANNATHADSSRMFGNDHDDELYFKNDLHSLGADSLHSSSTSSSSSSDNDDYDAFRPTTSCDNNENCNNILIPHHPHPHHHHHPYHHRHNNDHDSDSSSSDDDDDETLVDRTTDKFRKGLIYTGNLYLDEINILTADANGQMRRPSLANLEENTEESYYYENVTSRKFECQICFEECYVNERPCCRFRACNKCINLYIQTQIKESCGNVRIECFNPKCNKLIHRDEITERMNRFDRNTLQLYLKFLIDANNDPNCKTCPRCSHIMSMNLHCHRVHDQPSDSSRKSSSTANAKLLPGSSASSSTNTSIRSTGQSHRKHNSLLNFRDKISSFINSKQTRQQQQPQQQQQAKKKPNKKLANSPPSLTKVQCTECKLIWCFQCQAPWHDGITCDQFRKGDRMLKYWAREVHYGQQNAQLCPKCKIYIQRTKGCDHMVCIHCQTEFCYKCGEKFRNIKFVGDHYSKLSILGCKYRLYPNKPIKRKLIRGSIFGVKIITTPLIATGAVALGAGVLVIGCLFLPVYGSYMLIKRIKYKKNFKKCKSSTYSINSTTDHLKITATAINTNTANNNNNNAININNQTTNFNNNKEASLNSLLNRIDTQFLKDLDPNINTTIVTSLNVSSSETSPQT